MKRLARPLICLLISGVLFSVIYQISVDLLHGSIAAGERHTMIIALHLCLIFAILFLLGAAVKDEEHLSRLAGNRSEVSEAAWGVRDFLFLFCAIALEAALLSCTASFLFFSIVDRTPPLQWDRIGGVFTDWVIDVLLVLPLLSAGVLLNGSFLWSLVSPAPKNANDR